MTIVDIIVLILAIIGVYHIIDGVMYYRFVKQNKQFLEDFKNEYHKRNNDNNNKTTQ